MLATLSVVLMMAGAAEPQRAPNAMDEASLYFFMHSLYRRTQGDPRKGRRYVQHAPFNEVEIAKLVGVSRSFAFTYHDKISALRTRQPAISDELRSRLGASLYLKVLQYCRQSVEPRMRSVPPP